MSTLSLRLPNSLHVHAKRLALEEGISLNQLISTAVAEKLAAIDTEKYLVERASKADRKKFVAILGKVPDRVPVVGDEL